MVCVAQVPCLSGSWEGEAQPGCYGAEWIWLALEGHRSAPETESAAWNPGRASSGLQATSSEFGDLVTLGTADYLLLWAAVSRVAAVRLGHKGRNSEMRTLKPGGAVIHPRPYDYWWQSCNGILGQ